MSLKEKHHFEVCALSTETHPKGDATADSRGPPHLDVRASCMRSEREVVRGQVHSPRPSF